MNGADLKSGIHSIYKPKGITSHDVIDQLRRLTGIQKIGHAGTLDPLASGVLVVGIGAEATKQLATEVAKEKEYRAEVKLGVSSATDDEEGEKKIYEVTKIPNRVEIEVILKKYIGNIEQMPPAYSALKIKGTPAYKLARRGKPTELKIRTVEIKSITIIEYIWPRLVLDVVTGPGVYIRALARDIGRDLGIGGYLSALERTRVGEYTIDKAIRLSMHLEHAGISIHKTKLEL